MSYFICSNCGYGSASWIGRCPDCGQWNTLVDRPEFFNTTNNKPEEIKKLTVIPFLKIKPKAKGKNKTGVFEFDRVLGGGLLPGAVVLLTGEPGVGKSSLLLQVLQNLRTLYLSGEEAAEQIKQRAERLKINLTNFLFSDDIQVEAIINGIEKIKDKLDIIVIDSIQTIYSKNIDSAPGNIAQLKETASKLVALAKKTGLTIILVGHITKEGEVAGPKTLEHSVDCVLALEGEKISTYRILRATKNRFGSTDEIGIFEMKESGLAEIINPLFFLDQQITATSGKAIAGLIEGKRSLFFEIQSLTVPTILPVPRRVVKGVNYNKVLLLLAVIRKHLGFSLDKYDIYVNVVGGVEVKSTSADLAIIASILSSIKNIPLPKKSVFIGEVGLLGEIRSGFFEDKIINEAKRLKFASIFSSKNLKNIKDLKKTIGF